MTTRMRAPSMLFTIVLVAITPHLATAQQATNQLSAISTVDVPKGRAASAFRASFTKTTTNQDGTSTITAVATSQVKDPRANDLARAKALATASGKDPLVALASSIASLEPLNAQANAVADGDLVPGPGGNANTKTDVVLVRNGVRLP